MSCGFCSYSKDVQRKRDTAIVGEVEKFIAVLGKYKDETAREVLVSWIGGEPFLWKHLIPFSKMLHEEFNIKVSATTNGLPLSDPKIRASVIEYFSEIVFSLDGLPEFNDRVRDYKWHFDSVAENICRLKQEMKGTGSKLVIKVNTILMRGNIACFESFCEKLFELGVTELTFNQLGGFDRPEFYPENRLKADQVKNFADTFQNVQKRYRERGFIIHGSDEYLHRILESAENKKHPINECHPGKWFLFINENGFISPCSFTSYEYKFHMNDIKCTQDFDSVEKHFKESRQRARSPWCDDCHCTQVYHKFA
jgi:MoaA/NifB/PqqE/SkfB family radical SAM enzyme